MPETIGQRLKQARDHRNLTVQKAAEATRIRTVFLQALEADDYSGMTSAAQARGFLRNYASFLGLDLDSALAELQQAQTVTTTEISGPFEKVDLAGPAVAPVLAPKKGAPAPSSTVLNLALDKQELPSEPQPAGEALPASRTEVSRAGLFGLLSRWRSALRRQTDDRGGTKADASGPQATGADPVAAPQQLPSATEQAAVSTEDRPGAPRTQDTSGSGGGSTLDPRALLAGVATSIGSAIRRRKLEAGAGQPAAEGLSAGLPEEAERAEAEPAAKLELFEDIVAEIGQLLRQRRELLGLSYLEIENQIHLKAAILRALEEGAYDRLPSTVQLRGMLANYATFLDLEVERTMLRFADALQARRRQKYPESPRPAGSSSRPASMPPLRAFVAPDLLFGIGITAALLALGIWGAGRLLNPPASAPEVEFTAPSISEVLAGTSQPGQADGATATLEASSFTPAGEPGLGAAFGIPTVSGGANVRIDAVAVERAFMRVSVDGKETFNGRVLPGTLYPFEADEQVEILTGNGAALRITFNGRDMGLMGTMGQVVSTIYTASGIATATATLAPSPTPTSRFTGTPPPSSTATATATAENSAP